MDLKSDYCRICLKPENSLRQIDTDIQQNFHEICQKELKLSTNYSDKVCEQCVGDLENNQQYKKTLLDNQRKLEDLLLEAKIKEIVAEEPVEAESEVQEPESEVVPDCFDGSREESPVKRKRLKVPIKCPSCDKIFHYKSYFQFHFKDVHVQQNEICPTCGKLFKNSRRLNSHLLTHSLTKKYRCDQCGKEFSFSGDYKRHLRIHDNTRPYKCDSCSQSFKQSYALTLHKQTKHEQLKFECEKCGVKLSCKPTLKRHLQKCMVGKMKQRKLPCNLKSEQNQPKFKCWAEDCDKTLTSRKTLKAHLQKQHTTDLTKFDTTCLECHKSFDNIGEYSVHVKTHSCTFICNFCKVRFKTIEKLNIHQEKHKSDEDRPFKCTDCSASFKRNEHLRAHNLYKHSQTRPFKCKECQLTFRQRGEHTIHMRIHSGVKPFKCNHCDYKCKTSSNLRQHNLLQHQIEKIYKCEVCDTTFKYIHDLTLHKREVHPVE